jgi:hypothetical protein
MQNSAAVSFARQLITLSRASLFCAAMLVSLAARAQNPAALARQAVNTELAADAADHSHWLFYDVDRKPGDTVKQWVAQTASGNVHRVIEQKGEPISLAAQRSAMDDFVHDAGAQARQRKSGQHDDKQSEEMLRLLPDAFHWTEAGTHGNVVTLRFVPDASFKPPTWGARVFAAMEGDMQIDIVQHRIVSLKGHLIRDVRFCGGLCGNLAEGGTFSVERRQIGPSIWQIVSTHVHIQGSALFFKNISQEEDEEKWSFHRLPANITLEAAESDLLTEPAAPN